MLLDKEDVKQIVRYTESDCDDLIQLYIPMVQDDLCDHLNNHFPDWLIDYSISQAAFVSGDPDTITDAQSKFVVEGFVAGMDIAVAGAYANDGIYELATVAAGTLTLTTSNELTNMSYADTNHALGSVRIAKVNWPKALKIVAARMVWYLITHSEPQGKLSEAIDGTVVAYDRRFAYPREILEMASKYKRPRFV